MDILEIFNLAFQANFIAVLKVFLIAALAATLVRVKIINSDQIKALTTVTVNVLLPAMIFANITRNFHPENNPIWWILPITALATISFSILLARLFFWKEIPAKKNMLGIAGIQNAAYLVLPVGKNLFPDQFAEFSSLCFLYVLGMNYMLWSVGKYLTTSAEHEKLKLSNAITPPFVACLLSITLVLLNLRPYVPALILDPVDLLGQATVPLATFILGGVLGSIHLRIRPYLWDTARVVSVKLIITPLITIFVLYWLRDRIDLLTSKLLVLEAAVAPATGLILQVRNYGGDVQKVSSVMLVNYLLCLITMPIWMAVWEVCLNL